ncbi:hypothetical protein TIFTF001_031625 [Ficus carica]|uniref:Uncharacterized protein n=1 Tax=Ficus carica TaxID=3494 RepID=A0AA88DWV9_FICCA|nr:hypothetical protein TIFTF001_031625 [Ficus carica]
MALSRPPNRHDMVVHQPPLSLSSKTLLSCPYRSPTRSSNPAASEIRRRSGRCWRTRTRCGRRRTDGVCEPWPRGGDLGSPSSASLGHVEEIGSPSPASCGLVPSATHVRLLLGNSRQGLRTKEIGGDPPNLEVGVPRNLSLPPLLQPPQYTAPSLGNTVAGLRRIWMD